MRLFFIPRLRLLSYSAPALKPQLASCQVEVILPASGLAQLRKQLSIDIDAKWRRWTPIPFEVRELAEIDRITTYHADGRSIQPGETVRYTHEQRKLLARYVARYRQRAIEAQAPQPFLAYEQLLANLLERSNLLPASA